MVLVHYQFDKFWINRQWWLTLNANNQNENKKHEKEIGLLNFQWNAYKHHNECD